MTAADTTYNGWKNYETWLVNLHLSNDRGLYEQVNEIIERVSESDSEYKRVDAADAIKELCEELTDLSVSSAPLRTSGDTYVYTPLVSDLVRAALGSVDWFEIAETWDEEAAAQWRRERGEDVSAEVES